MSAVGTWLRDAAAVARQTVQEPQAFQIKAAEGLLLQTAMILLVWPPAEHLWIGRNRGNSCLTAIAARWLMLVEDPGSTRPERHFASGAAQTRTVSVGRIRLDSWKFMRSYKGIICGDISEFESYHPSHAVRSPPDRIQDSRTMCELLHTGSGRFTSIVAGSLSDR
jgi:hypothetical protein